MTELFPTIDYSNTLLVSELNFNLTIYPLQVPTTTGEEFNILDKSKLNTSVLLDIFNKVSEKPTYISQIQLVLKSQKRWKYPNYDNIQIAEPIPTNTINKFPNYLLFQYHYKGYKQPIWFYIRPNVDPTFIITKSNIDITQDVINDLLLDSNIPPNVIFKKSGVVGNGQMIVVNIPWNPLTFELFLNKFTLGLVKLYASSPSYTNSIRNVEIPTMGQEGHSISFETFSLKTADTKVLAWSKGYLLSHTYDDIEPSKNFYYLANTNKVRITIKKVRLSEFNKIYKFLLKVLNLYVIRYNDIGSIFINRYRAWIPYLTRIGYIKKHFLMTAESSADVQPSPSKAIGIMADVYRTESKGVPVYRYEYAERIYKASETVSKTTLTKRSTFTKGALRIKDESSYLLNKWIKGINSIYKGDDVIDPRISEYKKRITDNYAKLFNYLIEVHNLFKINETEVIVWEKELVSTMNTEFGPSAEYKGGGFDIEKILGAFRSADGIIEIDDNEGYQELIRMIILYNTFEALTYISQNQSTFKNKNIHRPSVIEVFVPNLRDPFVGIGKDNLVSYYNLPLYNPFFIRYLKFIKLDMESEGAVMNRIIDPKLGYKRTFTHGEFAIAGDILHTRFTIPQTKYAKKTRLSPLTRGKLSPQALALIQYILGKYEAGIHDVGKGLMDLYYDPWEANIRKITDTDVLRVGSFYDEDYTHLSIIDSIHNSIEAWFRFERIVASNLNELNSDENVERRGYFIKEYDVSGRFASISIASLEIQEINKLIQFKSVLRSISAGKTFTRRNISSTIDDDAVEFVGYDDDEPFLNKLSSKHIIDVQRYKDRLYIYYLDQMLRNAMKLVSSTTLERLKVPRNIDPKKLSDKEIIEIFEDILNMRFILIRDTGNNLVSDNQEPRDWSYNLNLKPTSILLASQDSTNPIYEFISTSVGFMPPILNGRIYRIVNELKKSYISTKTAKLIGRGIESSVLEDMVFTLQTASSTKLYKLVCIAQILEGNKSSNIQLFALVELSISDSIPATKEMPYMDPLYGDALRYRFTTDIISKLYSIAIDGSYITKNASILTTSTPYNIRLYNAFIISGRNLRPITNVTTIRNINVLIEKSNKMILDKRVRNSNGALCDAMRGYIYKYCRDYFLPLDINVTIKSDVILKYDSLKNIATWDGATLQFIDLSVLRSNLKEIYATGEEQTSIPRIPLYYLNRKLNFFVVANALSFSKKVSSHFQQFFLNILNWFDSNVQVVSKTPTLESTNIEENYIIEEFGGLEQINKSFKNLIISTQRGDRIPLTMHKVIQLIDVCKYIIENIVERFIVPNVLEGKYRGYRYRKWLSTEEITIGMIDYLIYVISSKPNVAISKIQSKKVKPSGDLLQHVHKALVFDSNEYVLAPEVVVNDNKLHTYTINVKNVVITDLEDVINSPTSKVFIIKGNKLILPNYKFVTFESLYKFINSNNCYIDYGIRTFEDLYTTNLSRSLINMITGVSDFSKENLVNKLGKMSTIDLVDIIVEI